jgi:CYTH domain-containing protein
MKHKRNSRTVKNHILLVDAFICLLVGIISTIIFMKLTELKLLPTQLTGGVEIERKWLLDPENIPIDLEKEAVGKWEITQTYFNFSPEMRVRKIIDNNGETYYTMAVKSDMSVDGLTRNEKEWYISGEEYEHILTKSEGSSISKTRYRIDKGDLHYEYDIFHDQLNGLVYLEIEFTSEDAAHDFQQPDYIIKDVTADKRYKNQELAQNGTPKD